MLFASVKSGLCSNSLPIKQNIGLNPTSGFST